MKNSIHQEVTDLIIAAIEKGTSSFQMPWMGNEAMPVRASCDKPYKGVNVLTLWAQAQAKGYTSNLWGGYQHWKSQNGQVRKGEKATGIIHFSLVERENKKTGKDETIPMVKTIRVFNRDQVDGLPELEPVENDATPLVTTYGDQVLTMAEKIGAKVTIEGGQAFYRPSEDSITMPNRELFIERENISADVGFASTLLHELVHWTSHSSRLNRATCGKKEDKKLYSFEEICAELGASFLCAELGFVYEGVNDHAGYIASWLQVLRNDNTAIFRAASLATEATNYILEKESEHESEAA